jgi:LacI family gluconate utilization system Gnt-I transcriptional repressor
MSRAGYEVLLALSGYRDANEESLLDAVLSRRPEGVLLTGVAHTDSLRERLKNGRILVIGIWDMTDAPIDRLVGFSHNQIGEAVTQHFLARGKAALPELIGQVSGIDAVFCGSDLLAIGALSAARQPGRQVPAQPAICGFGDLEFATETTPQSTTVRVDDTRLGQNAARFLLDRFDGARSCGFLDVTFSMIVREAA